MNIDQIGQPHAQLDRLSARLSDRSLEAKYLEERRETDLRRLRLSAVLGMVLSSIFFVLDWMVIEHNRALALWLRGFMALPASAALYAMTLTPFLQRRINLLGWVAITTLSVSYALMIALSGTPDAYISGFILVLMFLFFLFQLDFRTSVAIGAVCTMVFCAIVLSSREVPVGQLLTIGSQLLVTMLAGSFAVHQVNTFRRIEFLNRLRIAEQSHQYHQLLTRVLPEPVVARMEAGEDRIADEVPNVVVMFVDVVGFTDMAARHSADTVVSTLDRLFARFDDLVAKWQLEKIKTIGDAYMVAGGVPEPAEGRVTAAVELAIEMRDAAATTLGPDGTPLAIRAGLHTGPVLAGVIGNRRFVYDLWGDTVNLASRLQGAAASGSVLVSQEICNQLGPAFHRRALGAVELKGRGAVETWEVLGRE